MFGEKRNRKSSENVEEFEKHCAHTWCLLISFPSCGLWVLPEGKRFGVN
jgi:hypothetical protein